MFGEYSPKLRTYYWSRADKKAEAENKAMSKDKNPRRVG